MFSISTKDTSGLLQWLKLRDPGAIMHTFFPFLLPIPTPSQTCLQVLESAWFSQLPLSSAWCKSLSLVTVIAKSALVFKSAPQGGPSHLLKLYLFERLTERNTHTHE